MSAEGIFSVQTLYDNAGVEEGAADKPKGGGESAWLYSVGSAWGGL